MGARRVLTTTIGMLQSVIGGLAVIFTYTLHFNFFDVQTMLNITSELLPLYSFALIVFGSFSIISGLFLLHEGFESR
ncbi:MAG: hypothetical protein JSW29_07370 [Candidatus Bathyarchaeota archaeon]|nr:MAG: hypothetical protein JSW29_07370 [Candidatus Bathyarchaeota archaeon]